MGLLFLYAVKFIKEASKNTLLTPQRVLLFYFLLRQGKLYRMHFQRLVYGLWAEQLLNARQQQPEYLQLALQFISCFPTCYFIYTYHHLGITFT